MAQGKKKMILNNCNTVCRLGEMRSFDGTFSEGAALNAVAWTGRYFVVVGENGLVATSNNGSSWNKRQSRTTRDLNALAYVNKRLWAVGERGTVLLLSLIHI